MGGDINGLNEPVITIVTDTDNGKQGNSTASGSTTDTGTNTGRTTDGGSGGSGGRTTETKETIVSELAILTDEERKAYDVADESEKKRLLRNARRRERYKKEKANSGQTVKPRKVNKKSSSTKNDIDRTQINAVVGGISSAIASRPNCGHWLLSEQEIDSITKPLCEMMKQYEIMDRIMENMDKFIGLST